MTLASHVDKLKQRFQLDHVVLVGDRGMITQARITDDIKSAGAANSRLASFFVTGLSLCREQFISLRQPKVRILNRL